MITRAERQEIVDDFLRRHNGFWDPRTFRDEVQIAGESHPAFSWFQWDRDKAADEYQIWQARRFVADIRVSFSIETITRNVGTVQVVEAPHVFSPITTRSEGGGYRVLDGSDEEALRQFTIEGLKALRAWLYRYEAAVVYAGASKRSVENIINKMAEKLSVEETE
jgi:hypothetical protein